MKTLFQPIGDATESFSYETTYRLSDNAVLMEIDGASVLVNPDIGSWVVIDKHEEASIVEWRTHSISDQKVGRFLFEIGIAERNGKLINLQNSSCYTKELYFFEFSVTDRCNLACKYCFAKAVPFKNKTSFAQPEIAKVFVDRIAEHRAEKHSLTPVIIEFTGGEPLLNFDVIKFTVNYAKEQYGDLLDFSYTIQTNLTNLTTEQLDFIKKEKIGLGISCDGYEEIHDFHRPFFGGKGSHRKVSDNIDLLNQNYPENTGSVISVISKYSQKKMPQIMMYLYAMGYNETALRPMVGLGRGKDELVQDIVPDEYSAGLFDILDSVIEPLYIEQGVLLREQHLSLTFQYLLNSYRSFMCERSPCGGGRNICIVTENGNTYPCNQSITNEFLMGNINNKSFSEILNSSNAAKMPSRDVKKIKPCADCIYRGWCTSPCPIAVYEKHGHLNAKSPYCEIQYNRYKEGLRRLINDRHSSELIAAISGYRSAIEWRSGN